MVQRRVLTSYPELTVPTIDDYLYTVSGGKSYKIKQSNLGTGINFNGIHNSLTGLTDDDHTQYTRLGGRTGGQTLTFGTASTNNGILHSNPIKNGKIYFGDIDYYDERLQKLHLANDPTASLYNADCFPPSKFSIEYGTNSVPITDRTPVMMVTKISDSDKGAAADQYFDLGAGYFVLDKVGGSSQGHALQGFGIIREDSTYGEIVGISGRAQNWKTTPLAASTYGGYCYAEDIVSQSKWLVGHEVGVFPFITNYTRQLTTVGPLASGLFLFNGGTKTASWGLGIANVGAKFYSGIASLQDAIVAGDTGSEAYFIRGSALSATRYTGVRYDGYLSYGIDFYGCSPELGAIRVDYNQAVVGRNTTGTDISLLVLNSSNELCLGSGLATAKLKINIDGTLKTLSIDGSGFVKAA